jgi:hypothetical protein
MARVATPFIRILIGANDGRRFFMHHPLTYSRYARIGGRDNPSGHQSVWVYRSGNCWFISPTWPPSTSMQTPVM